MIQFDDFLHSDGGETGADETSSSSSSHFYSNHISSYNSGTSSYRTENFVTAQQERLMQEIISQRKMLKTVLSQINGDGNGDGDTGTGTGTGTEFVENRGSLRADLEVFGDDGIEDTEDDEAAVTFDEAVRCV